MSNHGKHAFTLVESIVVILITILLASIVIPGIFKDQPEEGEDEIKFIVPESMKADPTPVVPLD